MAQHKAVSDEKYEGASKATIALGKGKVYGWAGTVAGALAFGAITLLFPEKFGEAVNTKYASIKATTKQWFASHQTNFVVKTFGKIFGHVNMAVLGGAVAAGAFLGHYIGMLFGVRKGLDKAERGEEQFEKIKAERNKAENERDHLKEKIDVLHQDANPEAKYTETVASRGEAHVAALDTEKETATEIAR